MTGILIREREGRAARGAERNKSKKNGRGDEMYVWGGYGREGYGRRE